MTNHSGLNFLSILLEFRYSEVSGIYGRREIGTSFLCIEEIGKFVRHCRGFDGNVLYRGWLYRRTIAHNAGGRFLSKSSESVDER